MGPGEIFDTAAVLSALEADRAQLEALFAQTQERTAFVRKLGFGLVIGILAIGFALFRNPIPAIHDNYKGRRTRWIITIIASIAVGIGFLFWHGQIVERMETRTREALLPTIFERIEGVDYARRLTSSRLLTPRVFRQKRLVRSFDDAIISDVLVGSHQGQAFTLAEVRLTEKVRDHDDNSTKTETRFHGLLLKQQLAKPVSTPITLLRKSSWRGFKRSLGLDSQPIQPSGNAAFDEQYDIFSADLDASAKLMSASRVQHFLALTNDTAITGLVMHAEGDALWAAITIDNVSDWMELPVMGGDQLDLPQLVGKLKDDMAHPFAVLKLLE